jgi:serine/threonine protein kinase
MLGPGREVLPGYRLVRFLGQGGFGEVWECTAPGGVAKAVKATPVGNAEDRRVCRELEGIQRIRAIRHPYLLSIERFDVVDGMLYIVMELAEKNLGDRFAECTAAGQQGVPRTELLRYLHEAAEAIDVLNHKHDLLHMDVKPENLFLLGGHVKVADFGMVQPKRASGTSDPIAITPPYAAPEVFDGVIEASADQYSLAVTYQEMLTGYRPYTATDVRGVVFQHLRSGPNVSPLPACDRSVVLRALRKDPAQRFANCVELIDQLVKAGAKGDHKPGKWIAPLDGRPDSAGGRSELVLHPVKNRVERTTAISSIKQKTVQLLPAMAAVQTPSSGVLQAHFVAFLPIEIFAHKLRGFIDDMNAEIISIDPERTVLRFRPTGLFSGRRAVFLQIDTCAKNAGTGFRAVEATIWATDSTLRGEEFYRRGLLLIRYLKAHMMAVEREPLWGHMTGEQLRAALFE